MAWTSPHVCRDHSSTPAGAITTSGYWGSLGSQGVRTRTTLRFVGRDPRAADGRSIIEREATRGVSMARKHHWTNPEESRIRRRLLSGGETNDAPDGFSSG